MGRTKAKEIFHDLMESAGISIDGNQPGDIIIKNEHFYERVLSRPALGLGESYMDDWWECRALDQFFEKILRADLESRIKKDWATIWNLIKTRILNLQARQRAFVVGQVHYDIGNDLYSKMLDKRMQYTCGYWKDADNLDDAQEAKLELICKKTGLEPGMKVLELGCGFGGFAHYAAKKYGAQVTGFTVSEKQVEFAKEYCRGLPVDIRLDDYKNAEGVYDRVISVGLMEHVGYKNYRSYMELANRLLKDDGIAFVHTIGGNMTTHACNTWLSKYIFPNSMLPSIALLSKAMEGLFVMEDWHNFGEDYDRTLMAWYQNFKDAWPGLKNKYGDRFYRMWEYYLLSCAGAFRSRSIQLWQIVMTKPGKSRPCCRVF